MGSGRGGVRGSGPGPGTGVVAPQGSFKKKHIKKPEDFINTKDWDKFKCQEFLYYEEYKDKFTSDSMHIRFNLSFFVRGLPEKFATNFINQIIDRAVPNWGMYREFCTKCEAAFQDTNRV